MSQPNPKIKAIAERSGQNCESLIRESADKIQSSWNAAIVEAQQEEGTPKLKLAFTITLDLDKNRASYDLSWGVKYRIGCEGEIPDPDQQTLPLGSDLTVETGGKSVTLQMDAKTLSAMKRASDKLSGTN